MKINSTCLGTFCICTRRRSFPEPNWFFFGGGGVAECDIIIFFHLREAWRRLGAVGLAVGAGGGDRDFLWVIVTN